MVFVEYLVWLKYKNCICFKIKEPCSCISFMENVSEMERKRDREREEEREEKEEEKEN